MLYGYIAIYQRSLWGTSGGFFLSKIWGVLYLPHNKPHSKEIIMVNAEPVAVVGRPLQ